MIFQYSDLFDVNGFIIEFNNTDSSERMVYCKLPYALVPFIGTYGLYSKIGNGIVRKNIRESIIPSGDFLLALYVPANLIVTDGRWSAALSEAAKVQSVNKEFLEHLGACERYYNIPACKNLLTMLKTLQNGRSIGYMHPGFIDWKESVRATAICMLDRSSYIKGDQTGAVFAEIINRLIDHFFVFGQSEARMQKTI